MAVPLVLSDLPEHPAVAAAVGRRVVGLAGHAAFETHSVLTRLPPPFRQAPATVRTVFEATFPGTRFLSERAVRAALARIADLGIGGGAVYDALVAAAAADARLPLATRDQRALATYRAFEVELEILS